MNNTEIVKHFRCKIMTNLSVFKIKVSFLISSTCKNINVQQHQCKSTTAGSQSGLRWFFKQTLSQQIERVQSRSPAQSNTTATVTVVVHQRHLSAL